ncbi:MAG: VWA domain-containing protein [Planctomycetales bacterium]|jgi:Ca-activated chloride channel family protein
MNWPGFSAISNAWWLLLLVPLLVFYFLKLKRPRVEISSLVLWLSVVNDQRVNSPFQRFRRNILLWLQVAILVCLVAAAMQPFMHGSAEQAAYQPILIDCSASMAATDPLTGKTRLDLAKERVAKLIDNLNSDQRFSLIAVHSSADRLTEFTGNRRILHDALAALRVRDVPGQLEDALRLTQALAKTVPVESAVLFSDGNVPDRVRFALPFRVNYQQLPIGGPNAGITAFNARLASSSEWEVFIRVESSADYSGQLTLLQDGQQIGEQPFVLGPGESQRLTFRVTSETSTNLAARLTPGNSGSDSLAADNVAWLDLPAARPLRVYASETLSSFRRALASMPGVDLFPKDKQPVQRSVPYDLVISDQPDDNELLAAVYLLVGVTPDVAKLLVEPASGLTRFLDWDRTTPLLRHMQLRDVEIAEAMRAMPGVDDGSFEEVGYSVLASGTEGPLVLRNRAASRLTFHTLFHTSRSTLEFRVAFPVLVTNLVELARQEASVGEVSGYQTGVLTALNLDSGIGYSITAPDASIQTIQADHDGQLRGVAANLVGEYRFRGETVEPFSLNANLLNSDETTLASVDSIEFDEQSVNSADEILDNHRPLWSVLTLLAFGVLLVEWWFFQQPRRMSSVDGSLAKPATTRSK